MCHTVWSCLYLWCAMCPCACSSSLSTVRRLRPNPDRKLIPARSNLKSKPQRNHMALGGHSRRLLSGWADCGQKERTVTGSFLNVWTSRPGRFLKSSLIVASCTDEMLCILTFIRSHGDRRDESRRRFSCLENLLEDIKSSLRDEDNLAFSTSFLSSLTDVALHIFLLYVCLEHVPTCNYSLSVTYWDLMMPLA